MSIRSDLRRPPAAVLEPGYGSKRMADARSYYRALNKPLSIGGSVLVLAALIAQLLPPAIRANNIFNGIVAISLALFSIIGFLFLRTKFRITVPVLILGLIQIWIVVTVFIGPPIYSMEMKLGRNIWWPTFVLMPYLAAFVLVAIDPRWRTRLLNFILGVSVFTAIIAFLQFIKFPGALQLSGLYVDLNDLETFGLDKRAHGLSTHPFHLSAQCILGCGIVASNLLTRKLKVFEIGFYAILSAGLIVAQARSFYFAWVVITVITLFMCYRRDKQQFLTILCIIGAMVTAIVAAFPDQLSYGLSGKNTINEGRMSQWMRADELASQFPVTGIGPKETVFGSGKDFTGGGRWYTLYTESGYRMSRVSGGFIGLALMIGLVLSCLILSVVVFRDKNADIGRRQAAFAGFYFMLAMAMGLYITNIVENELITYYGMALAGIIAPQVSEVFKSQRGRSKMMLRRLTQAQTKLPSRTA